MKTITKIIEDAYLKGGNDAQNHGLWKITSGEQATKYATEVVNKNDLLPVVSKRSELLIAFGEKVMEAVTDNPNWSLESLAEDFESNL